MKCCNLFNVKIRCYKIVFRILFHVETVVSMNIIRVHNIMGVVLIIHLLDIYLFFLFSYREIIPILALSNKEIYGIRGTNYICTYIILTD